MRCAGSNPKDWKHPMPAYFNVKLNQGDDVGGIVEAVGSAVSLFIFFKVISRMLGFQFISLRPKFDISRNQDRYR